MDAISVLYLENSEEAMAAYEDYFRDRIDFDFVNNVVAFDYFLFSDFESYDFIIIDLSVNMNETPLDDMCGKIEEFKGKDIPTKLKGTLTLIGYDYIKYVLRHREKTRKMIKEGRVVVVSGHVEVIKKEGLLTDDVFKDIPVFDRAYSAIFEVDRLIRIATGRHSQ